MATYTPSGSLTGPGHQQGLIDKQGQEALLLRTLLSDLISDWVSEIEKEKWDVWEEVGDKDYLKSPQLIIENYKNI